MAFSNRRVNAATAALAFIAAAAALSEAIAGEVAYQPPITAEDIYNGGRGLITLTGPTGLFINPTSGTIGEGGATAQYCFFLPAGSTFDPSGHGWIGSYGITDEFEIGFISLYVNGPDVFSGGPQLRYRFLKDEGPDSWIPELSLVGYGRWGDSVGVWGLGPAAFKRFPIGDGSGFLKSFGVHGGLRYERNDDTSSTDLFNGYGGAELELPANFYLVGEVSSEESGRGETKVPYGLGIQWRNGLFNVTTAGVQDGTLEGMKFYFGVGLGFQF